MNGTLPFFKCRFTGGDTMRGVGTLKPYLMQKNLFELFALTGSGDTKTLGTNTCTISCTIAHAQEQWATWWNLHYLIVVLLICLTQLNCD